MVNLHQISKIEEYDEFFRIYLVSGDVEEVSRSSLLSALNADGSGYLRYSESVEGEEVPVNSAMAGVTDDDIEDMTGLSSEEIVAEADLSEGKVGNAYPEGSDVVSVRDVINNMTKDELIALLAKLQK